MRREDSLWKTIRYDRKGMLNTNTWFTFEKVFDHVKNHLTNVITRLSGIELKEVEIPQSDPSAVRTKDTPRDLLLRHVLPRAVVMYNIDNSMESRVNIPNMQEISRVNGGPQVNLFSIQQKRKQNMKKPYLYMRDIDMMLAGAPRFATASIFYSILVTEKIQAIELLKLLKYVFPIGNTKPMYAEKVEIGYQEEPLIKQYTLETQLPSDVIRILKEVFEITDTGTNGELELLEILQKHSKEEIEYVIDGSERQRRYILKYPDTILLTPQSIELIEREEGNTFTYGVKVEFNTDYLEIAAYHFHASLEKLNLDNKDINIDYHEEPKDRLVGYTEVSVAKFSEEIKHTTVWEKFTIKYIDEDIIVDTSRKLEDGTHPQFACVHILDLFHEEPMRTYIQNLLECFDDPTDYFNIECQRTFRTNRNEPQLVGMDYDFTIDWDDQCILDGRGKVGNKIFVAIYINKKHYTDWLEKYGYSNQSNLSSYN